MSNYLHLYDLIFNQPHLCTPEYAETVLHFVGGKFGVDTSAYSPIEPPKDQKQKQLVGNTFVLPIDGALVHKTSGLQTMSGIQSYESMQEQLEEARNDPAVKSVLLDMRSPGGVTDGLFDFFDYVKSYDKPVYALSRDTMASAAYLIGSACDKLYVTQSGKVGSIGVVAMHMDQSARDKAEGVKPTFIYAGKYKTAGNSHEPLEGEALEYLQESVLDSYEMFVNAVAEARGIDPQVIRDTEARVYRGKKAVSIGLADGVRTFDATLKELAEISPMRGYQPTSITKGIKMDKETMEKLEADFAQVTANLEELKGKHESLQAAVLAEGFKITKDGLEKAKEPEMIEVAGIPTDKATLAEHVLKALESAAAEKAQAELKAKATTELPNFRAEDAMALFGTFAGNGEVMKSLKAADALLANKMEEKGEASVNADMVSPKEKFNALVADYMEANGANIHKARVEVAKTAEGRKLQIEAMKEND